MLTDEQIVHVLRTRVHCPTYYVRNVLRETAPGLTTAALRRRLLKMEAAGVVTRHQGWTTSNQICWVATGSAAIQAAAQGEKA